jgi:hypothetical protein
MIVNILPHFFFYGADMASNRFLSELIYEKKEKKRLHIMNLHIKLCVTRRVARESAKEEEERKLESKISITREQL